MVRAKCRTRAVRVATVCVCINVKCYVNLHFSCLVSLYVIVVYACRQLRYTRILSCYFLYPQLRLRSCSATLNHPDWQATSIKISVYASSSQVFYKISRSSGLVPLILNLLHPLNITRLRKLKNEGLN